VRIAVYTDYPYRRDGDVVYAERAFVLFLGQLAKTVDRLVLIGRLNPEGGRFERSHYRVADEIDFAPLPHYESLASPSGAVRAAWGSARAFARAIDDVDAVWLLGPHPFCLLFAAIAAAKRKRVFLGVRQDLPLYARTRHPDRRSVHLIADALEGSYRLLARRCPAIVVGSELAANYRRGRAVLPINVSLIRASDVASPDTLPPRDYSGALTALSVGRLEEEKNPLLLADTMAEVVAAGGRWRLAVCGEGPLREALAARLEELGVADRVDLLGYLPLDGGLLDLYRDSHALLHESWTEGVPQILFEAFAAGLPVVATDVGGVAAAVGDDALLIPPGDAVAPAQALMRIADEPALRERLVSGGLDRARSHTLEAECERVARFFERPIA
jgi:glycosyltransferase involved in cell wall biosynthesis